MLTWLPTKSFLPASTAEYLSSSWFGRGVGKEQTMNCYEVLTNLSSVVRKNSPFESPKPSALDFVIGNFENSFLEEQIGNPFGHSSIFYLVVILILLIIIVCSLIFLFREESAPLPSLKPLKLRRVPSAELEFAKAVSSISLARSTSDSVLRSKSNRSQSTMTNNSAHRLIKKPSLFQDESPLKQRPVTKAQSNSELLQSLKKLYKDKQNFAKDFPESEDEEFTELFLDNGRFKQSFKNCSQVGTNNESFLKAFHKFEGQWYAVKKVPLRLNKSDLSKRPNILKTISSLNELIHPNIIPYITCWAEKSMIQKSKTLAHPSRRERLLSEHIDITTQSNWTDESDKQASVDDSEVLLRSRDLSSSTKNNESQPSILDFYIQMEYINGETLKDMLKKGRLSDVESFFIFNEILKGLSYLHSHNIAHKNIQPSKVVIGGDRVKLADFGLEANYSFIPETKFTAPESSNCSEKGAMKADIFSLGLVLLEMIAKPIEGKSTKTLLAELKTGVQSISLASISEEQKVLILELCENEPSDRPTCQEILTLPSFALWNQRIAARIESLEQEI